MEKLNLIEELTQLLNGNYTDVDKSDPLQCIDRLIQKIKILERMINSFPIAVYINDYKNLKHIWGNAQAEKRIGASIQVMNEKGIEWYLSHYCPEDIEVVRESIQDFNENNYTEYSRVFRIKPEGEEQWRWSFCKSTVFADDNYGLNKLVLGIAVDLSSEMDSISQMEELMKENIKLKNRLVLDSLTKREIEILHSISKGRNTTEIANFLNISFHTVNTHRKNISKKLDLHCMASLSGFAVENGL